MHVRQATTAVVTGKPLDLGGSQGRKEADRARLDDLREPRGEQLGMKRGDCNVIVQGFGNVGSQASLLMHEAGYRIVGVADIHGGLYNEKGVRHSQGSMTGFITSAGRCRNFQPAEKTQRAGILFRPCDILIPAATENQITTENAHRLTCRVLCEGATGRRRLPRTRSWKRKASS